MDPAQVLSGEPRDQGADAASAPDAAQWLAHPTPHDSRPEPGSDDWWFQLLLSWGKALRDEDRARFGDDSSESEPASAPEAES
jgi:hypothetical protein